MAVTHEVVDVYSEGPIEIGPTGNHAGRDVTIQNLSETVDVYLGGEGVTTESFGFKLEPKAAWSIELRAGDHIYATASESTNVSVFMLGLESFN